MNYRRNPFLKKLIKISEDQKWMNLGSLVIQCSTMGLESFTLRNENYH